MTNTATTHLTSKRGGVAAYLGIILVAVGLLTGLTSYPPLAESIMTDIGLNDVTYGLLGTIGPFTFAFASLITPFIARRITLEWTIVIAAAMIGAGQILRALAAESVGFFAWSIVAMLGIGAGNLLLPPLVKRFFPHRIVSVSSVYLTLMVFSTIYPPFLAVPLAQLAGWRNSIAIWGLIELIAVVPWIVAIFRERGTGMVAEERTVTTSHRGVAKKVWSHPTSWAMLVMYAMGVLNFYIVVAWLPTILVETAGADPATAGALLALYSVMGVPFAFIIAPLVAKTPNLGLLYLGVAVLTTVGYLGLWFAPGTVPWLWVLFAGVAPNIFSITLVSTNFRTKTETGGVTLTGMVAFGGYLVGAFGPVVVGVFASNGLDWGVTYALLLATLVVVVITSFALRKRVNVDE